MREGPGATMSTLVGEWIRRNSSHDALAIGLGGNCQMVAHLIRAAFASY